MNAISEARPVWARQVARAMEKKLDSVDCPFYWAKASEDILLKEPTCVWPSDPRFMYQVEEGGNEGLYVEVFHRNEKGEAQQLLVVKFLTSMKAASTCLGVVTDFLESFNPEQLQAA
jgi:hypothetical protein